MGHIQSFTDLKHVTHSHSNTHTHRLRSTLYCISRTLSEGRGMFSVMQQVTPSQQLSDKVNLEQTWTLVNPV